MKYLLSFYYGMRGKVIVDVPRVNATYDEEYWDEEDTLIKAAVKAGLDVFYPHEDVFHTFLDDNGYNLADYEEDDDIPDDLLDEFDEYVADWELQYISDLDGYIQYTGLEMKPVPPHYKVGIIEQNKNPLFQHYRGTRR